MRKKLISMFLTLGIIISTFGVGTEGIKAGGTPTPTPETGVYTSSANEKYSLSYVNDTKAISLQFLNGSLSQKGDGFSGFAYESQQPLSQIYLTPLTGAPQLKTGSFNFYKLSPVTSQSITVPSLSLTGNSPDASPDWKQSIFLLTSASTDKLIAVGRFFSTEKTNSITNPPTLYIEWYKEKVFSGVNFDSDNKQFFDTMKDMGIRANNGTGISVAKAINPNDNLSLAVDRLGNVEAKRSMLGPYITGLLDGTADANGLGYLKYVYYFHPKNDEKKTPGFLIPASKKTADPFRPETRWELTNITAGTSRNCYYFRLYGWSEKSYDDAGVAAGSDQRKKSENVLKAMQASNIAFKVEEKDYTDFKNSSIVIQSSSGQTSEDAELYSVGTVANADNKNSWLLNVSGYTYNYKKTIEGDIQFNTTKTDAQFRSWLNATFVTGGDKLADIANYAGIAIPGMIVPAIIWGYTENAKDTNSRYISGHDYWNLDGLGLTNAKGETIQGGPSGEIGWLAEWTKKGGLWGKSDFADKTLGAPADGAAPGTIASGGSIDTGAISNGTGDTVAAGQCKAFGWTRNIIDNIESIVCFMFQVGFNTAIGFLDSAVSFLSNTLGFSKKCS